MTPMRKAALLVQVLHKLQMISFLGVPLPSSRGEWWTSNSMCNATFQRIKFCTSIGRRRPVRLLIFIDNTEDEGRAEPW
ncbi:hypothetical protein BDR03DRAFT_963344 [Suillus americanus]|nr:hypothetical protein BDR03DRAFT_963344 [Suillus americanus]